MSRFTIKPSEGLGDTTVTVTAGNQQNRVDYSETHRFYIKGNEGVYDDCVVTKTGVGLVPTESYVHPDIIEFPITGGEMLLPIPDSIKTNTNYLRWNPIGALPTTAVLLVDWGSGFKELPRLGMDLTPDFGATDSYNLKIKLILQSTTTPTRSYRIRVFNNKASETNVYFEYNIKQIGIPTVSIDPKSLTITPTSPGTVQVTSDGEWAVKEI